MPLQPVPPPVPRSVRRGLRAQCPADHPRPLQERWAGRRPVLVVEDVHAADPSDPRDALDELPDWLPGGLLVMTSRLLIAPRSCAAMWCQAVVLGPLDRTMARALARARAGSRRLRIHVLSTQIADPFRRHPPPHPRPHRRRPRRAGGLARRSPNVQAAVPESLYDFIMARLDRLGPARALAQRCAVVGDPFSSDDLAIVSDEAFDGAGDRLATLVEAGVLVVEDGHYRFAHALLAQAAYDSLLNGDRAPPLCPGSPRLCRRPFPSREPERLAYHLEAVRPPVRRRGGAAAGQRLGDRSRPPLPRRPSTTPCCAVALLRRDRPCRLDRRWRQPPPFLFMTWPPSLSTTSHGSTQSAAPIEDATRARLAMATLLTAASDWRHRHHQPPGAWRFPERDGRGPPPPQRRLKG